MATIGTINEEGVNVDLYIPRKCHASNTLIPAFDFAAIQLNIGDIDANGMYTGQTKTLCIAGFLRHEAESDHAVNRLCITHGIIRAKSGRAKKHKKALPVKLAKGAKKPGGKAKQAARATPPTAKKIIMHTNVPAPSTAAGAPTTTKLSSPSSPLARDETPLEQQLRRISLLEYLIRVKTEEAVGGEHKGRGPKAAGGAPAEKKRPVDVPRLRREIDTLKRDLATARRIVGELGHDPAALVPGSPSRGPRSPGVKSPLSTERKPRAAPAKKV